MKKLIAVLLALSCLFAFAACNQEPAGTTPATTTPATSAPTQPSSEPTSEPTTEPTTAPTQPADDGVMSYEEFNAAALDSAVVVETYVQAVESWYNGVVKIYAQSEDGGYYIYDLACTEEDAAKFVPGTKIKVSGYKAEWSGEVEIVDATYEILEGSYIAEPTDVTALIGTEELASQMNKKIAIKGATVVASNDAGAAYLYKWDGSGSQGDDLYFKISVNGTELSLTVNVYMLGTGSDSEVYKAIEALQVGDVVDIEGFLYWYNGAEPHVTSVVPATETKGEGVMTYAEFDAAELDAAVTVETYIQAVESWYNGVVKLYTQDKTGGYYIYDLACTEEEAALLVPGTKIKVSGYKAEWSGEVEIVDATYEILEGSYIATATDVTALIGTEELASQMNKLIAVKGATVVASNDAGAAYLYKWDGSGSQGDDLYFKVSVNGTELTLTVNVYMIGTGSDSEVYKAIEALQVGDVVDIEGFLYWYNGAEPHVTSVVPAE